MNIDPTKYVRRWIACSASDGLPIVARQGRNTKATKEEVDQWLAAVRENNRQETLQGLGLDTAYAREWWCYPGHLDPFYPVE